MIVHVLEIKEKKAIHVKKGATSLIYPDNNRSKALKSSINGLSTPSSIQEYPIVRYDNCDEEEAPIFLAIDNQAAISGIDIINQIVTQTHEKKDGIIFKLECEKKALKLELKKKTSMLKLFPINIIAFIISLFLEENENDR